jgi:hypothetical protein
MGIISFFKRRFSKQLLPASDIKKHLVFVSKSKKEKIWFDKKLVVPEGFMLYFALKGKVLDEFPPGQHETKHIYLNKTIRALGLNKTSKKAQIPKWFYADVYYVNLKQFPVRKWELYTKVELFDSQLGYFKAMIGGEYIFKVENPKLFLDFLLNIYDYLMPHEANDLLDGRISEFVFKLLMKRDFDYKKINNTDFLTDFLFEKLEVNLKKIGVELLGFSVNSVKVSKKVAKRAKELDFDNISLKIENEILNNKDDKFLLYSKELNKNQDITEASIYDELQDNANNPDKADKADETVYNEYQDNTNEIVDKNTYKVCVFCGEKNDNTNIYCGLCGEKLL